jgi:hypothetical protein
VVAGPRRPVLPLPNACRGPSSLTAEQWREVPPAPALAVIGARAGTLHGRRCHSRDADKGQAQHHNREPGWKAALAHGEQAAGERMRRAGRTACVLSP